jgi:hypothetical protein
MFRRAAFDAVGGFDQERFGIAADLDMWDAAVDRVAHRLLHEYLMGYRHYTAQWSKQYERMRTEPEMFFAVMDPAPLAAGNPLLVSADALTCYRVWRVQDEAERAANAYVLGDRQKAVALLNSSLVRPLLRSSRRVQVARVLALRTLVRAAAASGTNVNARRLVHFARFRRFPTHDLAPPSTSAAHSLGNGSANGIATAVPNAAMAGDARAGSSRRGSPSIRVYLDPFTRHFHGNAHLRSAVALQSRQRAQALVSPQGTSRRARQSPSTPAIISRVLSRARTRRARTSTCHTGSTMHTGR